MLESMYECELFDTAGKYIVVPVYSTPRPRDFQRLDGNRAQKCGMKCGEDAEREGNTEERGSHQVEFNVTQSSVMNVSDILCKINFEREAAGVKRLKYKLLT